MACTADFIVLSIIWYVAKVFINAETSYNLIIYYKQNLQER